MNQTLKIHNGTHKISKTKQSIINVKPNINFARTKAHRKSRPVHLEQEEVT